MIDRRRFLQLGAASPLVLGLGFSGIGCQTKGRSGPAGRAALARSAGSARNVIFLVSDGMSAGTLTAADQYLQWRDGRHSHWMALYRQNERPVSRGLMDMSSLDSMVTDSAAASASWGGGHRVNGGSLNIGPNGEEYPPILLEARQAGKATGLVTTTTITHATPAGFAVNVPSRSLEPQIAEQYLERGYDLLLGGGRWHLAADRREDGRDLFAEFAAAGHAVVLTRDELSALPTDQRRVLGIFANGHLPYELDRLNSDDLSATVPSLAEMTAFALQRLGGGANGFVLQVEGGRVDHAAHANDLGALLFDQIAFDDAIAVALEFQQANPDTLVIVTTDHGNANPGFQSGPDHGRQQFERISRFRATNTARINPILNDQATEELVRERFKEALDLEISDEETAMLLAWTRGEYQPPYRRFNSRSGMVGQIVANHLGFSWIGNSHSADYVELAAIGPGSEMAGPFIKNTDLHRVMRHAMGLPARAVAV